MRSVSGLIELTAEVGQFLVPSASAAYLLYKGDYAEVVLLSLCVAMQKAEVVFLKKLYPKLRPDDSDMKSFPSGHTAGAFLGVGLLISKYGYASPTVCATAGAVLVAFSRYITKHHWPIDILAGASIGLVNGVLAGRKFFYLR